MQGALIVTWGLNCGTGTEPIHVSGKNVTVCLMSLMVPLLDMTEPFLNQYILLNLLFS
jgi:hypothetical protein